MTNGTVRFFNGNFGFIKPDDGSTDVFVHPSVLRGADVSISIGDRVAFESRPDRSGTKGPFCTRIERLGW